MILVIFLPMFFMIFMVFFPLFWALAICGCWFLPLTKFSKVLISVLILAMLCGGIAFLFFDKESRFFSFLFACGFISLPVFLRYFWRSQESYEKYYHIIHTNPLTQNNLKRRAISLFSIGLLGTFMSLWQVEVPQRIVFKSLIEAKVILSDRDYVVLEDKNNFGRTDNIAEGKWESYDDLFGIIRFSKKDFYACDTIDCKGKKKKIGEIHSSSISESTLHCALKLGGGCGLINASKSDSYSLLEYLKQNQNKQINKQGENNVTK